jgi:hypothetical protein
VHKNDPPYPPDRTAIDKRYCVSTPGMFTGFTDVDRQTVLNDGDGSLTGFANTISVNFNSPFFTAPIEAVECASDVTAKTSPYDYVTTVVYPYCGLTCRRVTDTQIWNVDCADERCYGVPLYRQTVTGAGTSGPTSAPRARAERAAPDRRASSPAPSRSSRPLTTPESSGTSPGSSSPATRPGRRLPPRFVQHAVGPRPPGGGV